MAISVSNFNNLNFSIVNSNATTYRDDNNPFSFIDFIKNINVDTSIKNDVLKLYDAYLIEWFSFKNESAETYADTRKLLYISLLKSIELDYSTESERRILSNIDFNDPLELETAIPFYVEKIKEICNLYLLKREEVKKSKSRWEIKGSLNYIKSIMGDYIIQNYTRNDRTFEKYKRNFPHVSDFQENYEVYYQGLYDTYNNRVNAIPIDISTFTSTYELSSLHLSSFTDYYRDSDLNDIVKQRLYKKYITKNKNLINVTNGAVSGLTAIDSETKDYDYRNTDTIYISISADTLNLIKQDDIEFYSTSRYIKAATYFSLNGITTSYPTSGLQMVSDTEYYNDLPYVDFYLWSKTDRSQHAFGNKPVRNPNFKRFYGYSSRETSIGDAVHGINRYTDNLQYWKGDNNSLWANDDLFDKYKNNIINREDKNEVFFNLNENEGVFKHIIDTYGNEYILIKTFSSDLFSTIQDNVYSIPANPLASTGSAANTIVIDVDSGIHLIAQTKMMGALSAIDIQPTITIALGYRAYVDDVVTFENWYELPINNKNVVIELGNYAIDEITYKQLNNSKYITSTIARENYNNYNSVYENRYALGRLYIKDAYSTMFGPLSTFYSQSTNIPYLQLEFIGVLEDEEGNKIDLEDNLTYITQLLGNIRDIDIIKNLVIITTEQFRFFGNMEFDHNSVSVIFTKMNSVIEVFKNKRLEKTGDYWYDGDNRVYFTNIKLVNAGGTNTVTLTAKPDYEQLGNQDFSYEIKKYVDVRIGCVNLDDLRQIIFSTNSFPITYIDEETHDGFAAYQDDFYVVDTDDSIPIIKNISKPSITVDDNNLYITIMMQDYYYNYYYSVLRYKIGTNNILTKLSSKTYRPEYIKLTDYLTFDSSQASMDYTNYILATSKIDTNLVYRKKVDNTIDVSYTIEKPTYSERIATYYDNDELEVVSRTLPILQYSLGDFYNVAPDAFIAEEEATYNYTIGTLYAPSDITLNYQQLSGYSNIINTEKIFKVIYRLGGEIISQDITDGSNSSSYDSTFNRSPVNNPPLVKTIELSENSNYGSFSYNIELYSVSGFRYVFAIDFYATNININEQFAKVELLDARVQKTDTGNNMVVYLNTREPNYITSVSLINI